MTGRAARHRLVPSLHRHDPFLSGDGGQDLAAGRVQHPIAVRAHEQLACRQPTAGFQILKGLAQLCVPVCRVNDAMKGFRSVGGAQRFLAAFSGISEQAPPVSPPEPDHRPASRPTTPRRTVRHPQVQQRDNARRGRPPRRAGAEAA